MECLEWLGILRPPPRRSLAQSSSPPRSAVGAARTHRRWVPWLLGALFAILLENYWIAGEIYPFVR